MGMVERAEVSAEPCRELVISEADLELALREIQRTGGLPAGLAMRPPVKRVGDRAKLEARVLALLRAHQLPVPPIRLRVVEGPGLPDTIYLVYPKEKLLLDLRDDPH